MATAASNLALVAEIYEHYRAGAFEPVAEVLAEEIVWRSSGEDGVLPWSGSFEGVSGVVAYREAIDSTIETLDYTVKEHMADADQVALWGTIRYRFHGDTTEYETDKLDLITLKEGKVTKFWEVYDTAPVAAAMKAATTKTA